MGSVKDLIVLREPQDDSAGVGRFIFSDRYSVFDWGEMPDHIVEKGKATCIMAAYFFEKLEKSGIMTHYLGIVEDEKARRLDELKEPEDIMEFRLLKVIKPGIQGDTYDYSAYRKTRGNFLIPLEIIYRNSLPEGSSVFKRLKEGSLRLEDIGLKDIPHEGQVLDKPILDVSTKLEVTDRYTTWDEAKEISNLSDDEIDEIKSVTLQIDDLITNEAKKIGLFNEDGKVEFGFDAERNLMLVDTPGTLDECRFTYDNLPVSKEVARIYYRKTGWYKDVEFAKNQDRLNWKRSVKSSPPPLPEELADSIALMYQACANELTGRRWFDAPPIKEVLNTIRSLI
ncbi:MAG: phosphoribosylaminoimidazole-succinocarboxamide synthase [Candidatus Syntrophoarchaeum caldarius]|uniref:Phosphoribosylaminoimidazole-succinocarboxamide synthase n=1 Tax=Candidatus Syntropharchaeum caldarium TaxID=1838285 RepID=A0A1F2P9C7_9EURY|nr:MAG: phosphoribosylaminoimidazole-succinocarboxamide synthase [Candidatus Syntrophoarchaeum caldarius]